MAATSKRSADPVQQAWALMQRFVDAHSRRGELAGALGFRPAGDLAQLAQLLTRLIDADEAEYPPA